VNEEKSPNIERKEEIVENKDSELNSKDEIQESLTTRVAQGKSSKNTDKKILSFDLVRSSPRFLVFQFPFAKNAFPCEINIPDRAQKSHLRL